MVVKKRCKIRRDRNFDEKEISGKVVKVGSKSDRVMVIVLTLGRELMRIICAYGHKADDQTQRKCVFF